MFLQLLLINFRWTEVEKGIYESDGILFSNTLLREVLDASPINDKRIFLVENCPKKPALPKNLPDVFHRARDIIFSDKSEHNIKCTKYLPDIYII
jgi:NTE family protein